MGRFRLAGASALAVIPVLVPVLTPAVAHADPPPPALWASCPPDWADAMTLLPDEQTYALCQQNVFGYSWVPVLTPFDPHETWVSYGPPINLHGQGMRNPNVTSGDWTATPQDPETVCRAEQQTVVEAGVLSDPVIAEGEPGKEMAVDLRPALFYLKLSGHCLWTKDD